MKCRCGKVVWKSYEQAKYQEKWLRKHRDQRSGSPYFCKLCNGWHLGHSKRGPKGFRSKYKNW